MPKSFMPDHVTDSTEAQAKSLLSLTRELLAIVTEPGEFIFVNESFERVLGYSGQELLGTPLTALQPPGEVSKMREKFAGIVAKDGATASCRCSLRAKSGQWRWFEVQAHKRPWVSLGWVCRYCRYSERASRFISAT